MQTLQSPLFFGTLVGTGAFTIEIFLASTGIAGPRSPEEYFNFSFCVAVLATIAVIYPIWVGMLSLGTVIFGIAATAMGFGKASSLELALTMPIFAALMVPMVNKAMISFITIHLPAE